MGIPGFWSRLLARSTLLTRESVAGKVLAIDVLTFSVAADWANGPVGGALYIAFLMLQLALLGPSKMHVSSRPRAARPPLTAVSLTRFPN